ncbi:MAG TPA: heparin lyase I family protein [Burkholderiales bacterium]|nr:heparin lyase I family protein [Burkholderiales bacterium]
MRSDLLLALAVSAVLLVPQNADAQWWWHRHHKADTTAPTTPTGLVVSGLTATSVTLSWIASSDNVRVAAYRIYSNDAVVGSTSSTSLSIGGLVAGASYAFTVAAVDSAGNVSAPSAPLPVTTPTPAPAAQILWSAGMETGDLSEWSEKVDSGSADSWAVTAASQGIPPKGGQWVMKQSVTGTSGGTRMSRYPEIDSLTQAGTTFYMSWWEYYPAKLTASASPSSFMFSNFQVLSQDNCATCWYPIWGLYINPADFTTILVWSPSGMAPSEGPHAGESGKRAYYATQAVPVGQWIFFEAMIKPAADFTGAVKLWMNGGVLFDLSSVKTRFPTVGVGGRQWTAIDGYGSYINPTPATHYIDDVTISLGRLPYP